MRNDIQKYIRCMNEIKLRYEVIDANLKGLKSTGQIMTDIEFVCLQFRKIGELIILSALCVHKEVYQKLISKIEKEWNAKKIKKILDHIHPEFYPDPFLLDYNSINKPPETIKVNDDYLTKNECIDMIGKCGGILHAFNPYNDKAKYNEVKSVENKLKIWKKKIWVLLNQHIIKLYNSGKLLFVYMSGGNNGDVLVKEMEPENKIYKYTKKKR